MERLAKSQFFQHYTGKGNAFERLVTKDLHKIEPFKIFISKGFIQLDQIHLKGDKLRVVIDNLLVRLETDAWGDEFFRCIINESKLNKWTAWTKNQKLEIVRRFYKEDGTLREYIEFELRSSADSLGKQITPKDFKTGVRVRIYANDVFKTVSDGNGKIGKIDNFFDL